MRNVGPRFSRRSLVTATRVKTPQSTLSVIKHLTRFILRSMCSLYVLHSLLLDALELIVEPVYYGLLPKHPEAWLQGRPGEELSYPTGSREDYY